MHSKSRLIRNAAIAAFVGCAGGAIAGLWSVRQPAPNVALAPKPAATVVAAAPDAHPDDGAQGQPDEPRRDRLPQSVAVATKGVAGPRDDRQDVLQRARSLAQRPDVNALVALRAGVSRLADERGDQESPATRRLLEELDRYLAEARQLRLKLDGDELRKTQPVNRPR